MKNSLFFAVISGLLAGSAQISLAADATPPVVAQVGPVSITAEQMNSDTALQLAIFQSETDLFNKKRAWIDRKTREILSDLAAKDAKLSLENWRKKEIDALVTAPTAQEIDQQVQQYTQQAAQRGQLVTNPEFAAQMKKQVTDSLTQQRKMQREQQVFAALTQKYPITVSLAPPAAPNVKIPYNANDPVKGPANARVTIVEYTDFQCAYCKRSQDVLHQVLAAYPNDVKLVAKAYPLNFHNRAKPTAEAAFCAQDQNKFWEYRDAAFASSPKLDDADLLAVAKQVGLNMKKFEKCYNSHKYSARVDEDMAAGQAVGVQGTPHFFINAQVINGAQPFESFKAAVEKELAKK